MELIKGNSKSLQIWLVFALTGLYNSIKNYLYNEDDYFEEGGAIIHWYTIADSSFVRNSWAISTFMNRKRERIASEMWADNIDILV